MDAPVKAYSAALGGRKKRKERAQRPDYASLLMRWMISVINSLRFI